MKKISILLLAFGLLVSSCEKALDIQSEVALDANSPLSSDDVDKLLIGAYSSVMKPNDYGFFNIMAPEILAQDNLEPVKFQWVQVKYMYEHTTPPGDILLTYLYKDFYKSINRANTVIRVSTASNAQKGKARYVRALSYLRLYDLYEGVPLVNETYDGSAIKASSPKDVLNFIINDLKFAKDNIEPFNANDPKALLKPTKEAAMALLARVYRMNGDIQNAGLEAEALIKSGKFAISDNPKDLDAETILKFKGNRAEENGSWGWILSYDASTWNCFAASQSLLNLLGTNDTRKVLFDFDEAPSTGNFVFSNKYSRSDDSDLLISRIPEMYLISAEAGNANRLTELQTKRNSTLSLDNERRLELSFEWVRWSDLKLKGEKYKLPFPQGAVDANELLGQ
ncbi:RagB/SusD family nutrient uptake outer membrane protein [Chryseobacterium tructae]|uniref:RagB/SusD family nutrient uptake outer membrane protein n=1 Tax=Chryseobacterium tructae TaxID=1037380 RepID=A0ABV7XPR0_9FLAO|nr:RagB/SusD family nutrient uptake outer membrane protein [Chryseobacterium tructae]MDN3695189.1 RagB/SusD family nutrient uptake outer membrane protein [Chryseobacterium tructae]